MESCISDKRDSTLYFDPKVLPGMRERKWGRIVNFSSVLGMAARSGRADYVVSKHAMLGLTRATAAEIVI